MGEGERRRFAMNVDEALLEILGPLEEAGTISSDVHINFFVTFNDFSMSDFAYHHGESSAIIDALHPQVLKLCLNRDRKADQSSLELEMSRGLNAIWRGLTPRKHQEGRGLILPPYGGTLLDRAKKKAEEMEKAQQPPPAKTKKSKAEKIIPNIDAMLPISSNTRCICEKRNLCCPMEALPGQTNRNGGHHARKMLFQS